MKEFEFLVCHGYKIMKCVAEAKDKQEIENAVLNGDLYNLDAFDCLDEYDTDEVTKGYELIEIYELN